MHDKHWHFATLSFTPETYFSQKYYFWYSKPFIIEKSEQIRKFLVYGQPKKHKSRSNYFSLSSHPVDRDNQFTKQADLFHCKKEECCFFKKKICPTYIPCEGAWRDILYMSIWQPVRQLPSLPTLGSEKINPLYVTQIS